VRAINRSLKQDALPKSGIAPQLVNHLKQCASRSSNRKIEAVHTRTAGRREQVP
jgi:hypothetical protein